MLLTIGMEVAGHQHSPGVGTHAAELALGSRVSVGLHQQLLTMPCRRFAHSPTHQQQLVAGEADARQWSGHMSNHPISCCGPSPWKIVNPLPQ